MNNYKKLTLLVLFLNTSNGYAAEKSSNDRVDKAKSPFAGLCAQIDRLKAEGKLAKKASANAQEAIATKAFHTTIDTAQPDNRADRSKSRFAELYKRLEKLEKSTPVAAPQGIATPTQTQHIDPLVFPAAIDTDGQAARGQRRVVWADLLPVCDGQFSTSRHFYTDETNNLWFTKDELQRIAAEGKNYKPSAFTTEVDRQTKICTNKNEETVSMESIWLVTTKKTRARLLHDQRIQKERAQAKKEWDDLIAEFK